MEAKIYEAACAGDPEKMKRLLEMTPHFLYQALGKDPFGGSLLHVCAVNGHTDCVKWLLERPNMKVWLLDSDVRGKSNSGTHLNRCTHSRCPSPRHSPLPLTPVFILSHSSFHSFLQTNPPNSDVTTQVNVANRVRNTPLILASERGQTEVVSLLLGRCLS